MESREEHGARHRQDVAVGEYSEDDIVCYLVDEGGTEVGFVVVEDGHEVECYYEEGDWQVVGMEGEPPIPASEDEGPDDAQAHSSLDRFVAIAGRGGEKAMEVAGPKIDAARDKAGEALEVARGKAEVVLDDVRGKAANALDDARDKAGERLEQAKQTAKQQAAKVQAKMKEAESGITRESVREAGANLNAFARESAEFAGELRQAYVDIRENFGFIQVEKKTPKK